MNAKNRILIFALFMAAMLGFANIDVLAANISSNGTGGGNWNSTGTWSGGVVPTVGDNVTITSSDVVVVNTNVQVSDLIVQSTATLKPDVGTRTITIDDDFTVSTATAVVNYNNSTGTLNWIFTGSDDGVSDITTTTGAAVSMNNVTFTGTTTTTGDADFTVYGNLDVTTGSLNATVGTITFSNSATKTITNANSLVFFDLTTASGAAVTSSSDFTISGDLTTTATSSLSLTGSAVIIKSGASKTITNNGTLTFGASTTLNITGNTTLAGADITNFSGALQLAASTTLDFASFAISGTGSASLGTNSGVLLVNASGLAGALNLTGARTFPTVAANAIDVTFKAGTSITGFDYSSGNDLTVVRDLTATGTVTSTDSFTVGDDFAGAGTFTATTGTITFSGTNTMGTGTYNFFDLTISAGTSTLDADAIVSGSLVVAAAAVLDVADNKITMNGTGNLNIGHATTAFLATGGTIATDGIFINTTGTVTNVASFSVPALASFNLVAGTLDMASTAITSTGLSGVKLDAGTIRTSISTGFVGAFPQGTTLFVSVASGLNFDFYGDNTQTTFGFFSGVTYAGTGIASGQIASIGNLTITGGATTALSPAIVSFGATYVTATSSLTVAGNFTATGAAVMTIPHSTTDNAMIITGTRSITIASTAAIQFNYLSTPGTVTTTSNFTIAGILTVAGTFTASTPSVITYASGVAAQVTPVAAGALTFFDLALTGTNTIAPGTGFTVAGNLVNNTNGAGLVASAGVITMSGTSKNIYLGASATAPTFFGLTVSGTVAAPAASATPVTAAGQTMATTLVSNFSILTGGTLTVSGSLTAGNSQVTTFAGTGTLAGAGTKSFYDLTWVGAVGSAVSLTVRNDATGSAAWTQSASTFTVTAADGISLINTGAAANLVMNTGELALAPAASSGTFTMDANDGVTVTGVGAIRVYGNATIDLNGTLQPAITGTGIFETMSGSQIKYGTAAGLLTAVIAPTTVTTHANTDLYVGAAVTNFGFGAASLNSFRDVQVAGTAVVGQTQNVTVSRKFEMLAGSSFVNGTVTEVVTMSGSTGSIVNAGTLTFGKLVITGTGVTTAGSFSVANTTTTALDVQAAASFIASAGTITFTGGATAGINVSTTAANATLYNITVNGADLAFGPASATMTIANNLTLTGATDEFDADPASTVIFSGTSGVITNTVDYAASSGISLGDVYVTGSPTVTGNFIIDVEGDDFRISSTGNFTPGTGTVNFNNSNASATVTMTNDGTLVFNNLTTGATAANVLTTASNFTVAGNMTLQAADTYWQTAGTLSLSGAASAVTVGATAVPATPVGMILNSLTVKSTATGATTVGAFVIDVTGDITVETGGSLVMAATGTTNFKGGTTKTITNTGTLTFGLFAIADVASNNVTTATDFNVAGDGATAFVVGGAAGGKFTATAGTVTISGANANINNANTLNLASALTFYGLNLTGAAPDFDVANNGREMYVKGDLTFANSGAFTAGTGGSKIWLNGTAEQTITLGTGTVDLQNITINNSNGAKLASTNTNITAGQLTILKTLRLQSGDLDLNGNNIVEIDPTAGLLSETPGNTVKNTGVSTATGYIYITDGTLGIETAKNLGGLGAQFTSTASMGSTTVKRYHISRTVGAAVGITRYYEISSATAGATIAATLRYDDSELAGNTESSLELVNSSAATGPWYYATATKDATNNYLRVTGIDQFTGANTFFTAAIPSLVEMSQVSLGVEPTTSALVAGTTGKAILGAKLSSTGAVTVNSLRFDFNRTLTGTELTNFKLYASSDNDFSTTSDNTLLVITPTGGTVADNYVAFTLTTNNTLASGSPVNYFLVADVNSTVTAATAALTPSLAYTNILVTDGIVKAATSLSNSSYTFLPSIMAEPINKGLSESALVAGSTNNAIIGFAVTSTSVANFTGFTVTTSADATNIFENFKVYQSTDNDYSTTADNVLLTTTTTPGTNSYAVTISGGVGTSSTQKNFFVVAGVKNAVDASASNITTSIAHSSFVSTTAGIRYTKLDGSTAATTIAGKTFNFTKATATLGTANMPATGYLGRNVANLPIFGFSITPDNAVTTVGFTAVTMNVTFGGGASSSDVTAWKLYSDLNSNGYPDAGELIGSTSSLTSDQLVFSSFTTAQSLTAARKYIVTASMALLATSNGTIVVSMPSKDYVTITSPVQLNTFATVTGNTQTIKIPGTAVKLALVGQSSTQITTGGTVGFAVQAQDNSGVPANVTATETATLGSPINATVSTNTGSITAGSNYTTVTPTLTYASGTVSELLVLSGSSLTVTPGATKTSSAIKILPAQPTTQATDIVLGTLTATTAPVSSFTAGNGAGRLVVVREGLPPVAPTDGTSYTAVANVKNATASSQTGPGSFVVLNTTSATSAFTVLGLTPDKEYFFQVFEYNGTATSGLENYVVTPSYTSTTVQNPKAGLTPAGSLGAIGTATSAAAIATDLDITGAITSANDTLFYQFVVNASKPNVMVKLSNMPANYTLELYDINTPNSVASPKLLRSSAVLSTGNDIVILNSVPAGNYIVKVYSASSTQYSTSNYTIRVTTSGSEIYSQPVQ